MNILKNLTLILLSLPILLSAQTSTLNTEMSKLKWTGKKITNSSHYGSLKFKSGEVMFSDGLIESGKFVVDMTTITVEDIEGNGKSRLEGHLRSDDFFSVETFPIATLIFTSDGNLNKANQLLFTGNLTIKDSTHPITFLAEINNNDQKLEAIANMSFDRSKYNVRFRSGTFFQNLGDKLIYDEIEMAVSILTQ